MNNLAFCLKNGIELFLGRKNQIFITLNGYIKLSGKPKQTIGERTTRATLVGKVLALPALKVPGRATKGVKLIPDKLALEWLAKDNPELANAIGGDLLAFLQQPIDLAQFHKSKTVEIVAVIQPDPQSAQALDLTVLNFGSKGIRFERRGDRIWVSLTDMAKATGKLVAGWTRLEGTIEFLTGLESVMQIRITETVQGGVIPS